MSPRRASKKSKASKNSPKRSPSPNAEVIQRRLSSRRRRAVPKKTKDHDPVVNTDEGRGLDILDIINSTHYAKHAAKEDEEKFVEVADEEVDKTDDDYHSDNSSISSGPCFSPNTTPKKHGLLQGTCSACRMLYWKAKKMKAPIKNKLSDNNPKSLTCDQWVLIKSWRPRRLPDARGELLTHVKKVQERLTKNVAKHIERCDGEVEPSACSRPHAFLQRNLRRPVRVDNKKERKKNRRRKRTGDESYGARVAKQPRLLSNNHQQQISVGCTDNLSLQPTSSHNSSSNFEGCSKQEIITSADTVLTKLTPCSVTLKRLKPSEVPAKQTEKKNSRFKDLLAQLRGKSSTIVRETR